MSKLSVLEPALTTNGNQDYLTTNEGLSRIRYAVITPVRDEEGFIGEMIDSIMSQTIPPSRWIIVDDGSRDKTPEIVLDYARRFGAIELLRLPERDRRLAGGEGAIPNALRCLDLNEFEYLARFDADLYFPPDYMANLLDQFKQDPKLGIAGGVLYIERSGAIEIERNPEYHVRGALKLYRRECFRDIGGLTDKIGWDTIDEVSAWTKGWVTRSFFGIRVKHRRPTGEGIAAYRVYCERGRGEYLTWSHPAFVIAKSLKRAIEERSVIGPICYLAGFFASYLRHEDRIQNADFTKVRRKQQLARLAKTIKMDLGKSR